MTVTAAEDNHEKGLEKDLVPNNQLNHQLTLKADNKKKQMMSSISEVEAEDMSSNVGPISNSTPSLALGQTGGTRQTFIRMASRLSFNQSEFS